MPLEIALLKFKGININYMTSLSYNLWLVISQWVTPYNVAKCLKLTACIVSHILVVEHVSGKTLLRNVFLEPVMVNKTCAHDHFDKKVTFLKWG